MTTNGRANAHRLAEGSKLPTVSCRRLDQQNDSRRGANIESAMKRPYRFRNWRRVLIGVDSHSRGRRVAPWMTHLDVEPLGCHPADREPALDCGPVRSVRRPRSDNPPPPNSPVSGRRSPCSIPIG